MRRTSSKLLSHLRKPHATNLVSLISRDFAAYYPKPHLKSKSLLFSSHTSKIVPDSIAQNASLMQKKFMEISQLEENFESAKSLDEMLAAFKVMEEHFVEKDLGMACLKIALKLESEGQDPEKALTFAQRALSIMQDDDNTSKFSLPIAMALQVLGSSSFSLKKFSDSLGYLNRANRLLRKLEGDTSFPPDQVLPVLHSVQYGLFHAKTAMGRNEEAVGDLRNALEIKEKVLDQDSKELGNANRDVAEAYVTLLNFKEALPFSLKALEFHKSYLGNNSVEVANDRRLLGVIYIGLGDHQKALEQNQLSRKVLKKWGRSTDLLRAEIDAANMQIALGRNAESLETLKGVLQQTEQDSVDRAMIFTAMAKALSNQDKFADAKRCLEIACGILGKKERSSPQVVVEAYVEIATEYESINEFESAISLLKKTLGMLEKLPPEQHLVGSVSARIGWLLLLTGSVEQGIPYLEDAAERFKESFGSKHFSVGYAYNNLGAAYLEVDRPQSAVQAFTNAKEIMDVSLGPHHTESIEAHQNISKAYAAMGSYPQAIDIQEKVVEGWERHGSSAKDQLDEAVRVLNELKATNSSQASQILQDAMPDFPDNDDAISDFLDSDDEPLLDNEESDSAEDSKSTNSGMER